MPGWVDPDSPDEADDGHPGAGPDAEAADEGGAADLAHKPVLAWTNEDWARWIGSADTTPVPQAPAPSAGRAATPGPAEEATGAGPGAGDAVEESEPGHSHPWAPPGGNDADIEQPGHDPLALADAWTSGGAPPEPVAVDLGPGGADQASSGPRTETGPDEEPGSPESGEWSRVADHPWWESAPIPDPADLPTPAPGAPEDEAPVPAPATTALPMAEPHGTAQVPGATNPPTRTMPAAPPGRSTPVRRQPVAPDPSHRVRSAFGLLVVAVMIGLVTAGLITVTIFVISLALRRAVG